MKKIMLIIAALFVLCIVPISTTQAMPQRAHGQDSFASDRPNPVLSVFNQSKISGMVVELSSRVLKDNILSYDPQEPRETTIAQSGKSTTTTSKGKKNPHVKRRGRGKSTMGDNLTEKDGEDDGDESEEDEEFGDDSAVKNSANDGNESEEDEEFGDDSAIKYNKGLKNSSGYNKDL